MVNDSGLLRIGVFYDGTYFAHVSNYHLYHHPRRARLSIGGIHEFVREEVSKAEGIDKRFCQIVDAHYFRGRLTAKQALEHGADQLYRDRQWDDVLIREGVTMHFLPLAQNREGDVEEKGIDVWFALEAFELAMYKRFDVSVLVSGDGDFVPLVRKLNTLGTRVMLLAWDFNYQHEGTMRTTRVNQTLINEVTYAIMMSEEIETRTRKRDVLIDQLFVTRAKDEAEMQPRPAARPALPAGDVATGTVELTGEIVTLTADKGFGFIRPDGGGDNLFFHFRGLVGTDPNEIAVGMRVSYCEGRGERGPIALNVEKA